MDWREQENAAKAVGNGNVGPDGWFVGRFEELVAQASGRKWAIAVESGTAAIHVAAYALGFAGKEIEVPKDAFPAAANVFAKQMGCTVHYVGGGANHDCAIYRYGAWPTLADRAPALGEVPTEATAECYSFARNKIVTCGKGGAVVGDDVGLEREIRALIHPGYDRYGTFNYRMYNVPAAIGCAQMEKLKDLKAAKLRVWEKYCDDGFDMVDRGVSRWMATVRSFCLRDDVYKAAQENDIEIRREPTGISIPCGTGMTDEQQNRVMACLGAS